MFDDEHSIDEARCNTIGDTSDGKPIEVTRLISARLATNFERGLYYGKHS